MSNKLINEKSPYLLQHKDNPVNWYPWCREAFQKAKTEDKPIFLSIGYSTCHWCHVMAHESFEDKNIADLLDSYVCIKVDREERPDIDAVYMSICQTLTGSGGWPLTVFMTPDKKPFFVGTYFPKTSKFGQLGLNDILPQISDLWNKDKNKLIESSHKITFLIDNIKITNDVLPDKNILITAYQQLSAIFDDTWGGFGYPPKFPTPHNLFFLMRFYSMQKEPNALQMVEKTLTSMAAGGIFDHIGGGFSRYSTDEKWLVPHFEKMLYDNSLLLSAYLEAYQLTQNTNYSDIARRTADYILRELTDENGGFYCGQDADSDGIEGKYYLFTPDEINTVLGKDDADKFCNMYNISANGNFNGKSIPNRINIPSLPLRSDDPIILKLLNYRKNRAHLHSDNKIILSWNAWAIAALATAGSVLDEDRYTAAAVKAYDFIKNNMTDENCRLYHCFCDSEVQGIGLLDDYAVYSLALIELYKRTFDLKYLKDAIKYATDMIELFEDKEHGGFYMTAIDAEKLLIRPKEIYDGAMPSGNSSAAMVLRCLAEFTGDELFSTAAERQYKFLMSQINDHPAAYCYALSALSKLFCPHRDLIFASDNVPPDIKEFIRNTPLTDISIIYKSHKNEKKLSDLLPFTNNYPASEHAVYYMCEGKICKKAESSLKNCL